MSCPVSPSEFLCAVSVKQVRLLGGPCTVTRLLAAPLSWELIPPGLLSSASCAAVSSNTLCHDEQSNPARRRRRCRRHVPQHTSVTRWVLCCTAPSVGTSGSTRRRRRCPLAPDCPVCRGLPGVRASRGSPGCPGGRSHRSLGVPGSLAAPALQVLPGNLLLCCLSAPSVPAHLSRLQGRASQEARGNPALRSCRGSLDFPRCLWVPALPAPPGVPSHLDRVHTWQGAPASEAVPGDDCAERRCRV